MIFDILLKFITIFGIIIFLTIVALVVYACCIISSRYSGDELDDECNDENNENEDTDNGEDETT